MAREFTEIAGQLETEIANGTYTDALPSISRMSEMFSVCPATVKRILSYLRDRDLVIGEHGRCVRVNPRAAGNPYFRKNVFFLADVNTISTPVFSKILKQVMPALGAACVCTHVFISPEQVRESIFRPDCVVVINSLQMNVVFDELLERYPDCGGIVVNMSSSHYPSVAGNSEEAGYAAIRHLAEDCGHTHIGVLTTQLNYPQACFARRYNGAKKYASMHRNIRLSMAEVPELEYCGQGSFQQTEKLFSLDPQITAVFAVCDMLTLGVYGYAAEHKLSIPEDIAVIGFDNMDFSTALVPPLSTIAEDTLQISDCLLGLIRSAILEKGQPGEYLISPRLLIRGSTQKGRISISNNLPV
ncbi:MAG: substrate-binding domain-containing protein [Lentisphaeria bacterium]|nr:substrate-binding domain-containing protein [Lentisphaeria bacterium]